MKHILMCLNVIATIAMTQNKVVGLLLIGVRVVLIFIARREYPEEL